MNRTDYERKVIFKPYASDLATTFELFILGWYGKAEMGGVRRYVRYRLDQVNRAVSPSGKTVYCERTTLFTDENGERAVGLGCGQQVTDERGNITDHAVKEVMYWLTLKPGDADEDLFAGYTPEQRVFCARHAESLSMEVNARFGED